jgi:hypothetical protein
MKKSDSNFSLTFEGNIDLLETAVYHFILASEDGSKLMIAAKKSDSRRIAWNDRQWKLPFKNGRVN